MPRTVLIIDDEVDHCSLIAGYLKRKNFQVACAHTLKDGIQQLEKLKPDNLF